MFRQYFIQAFHLMKENPYISIISVLGTALSIAVLMAFYIGNRSHVMDIAPENARHRTLYVKWVGLRNKEQGNIAANGFLSLRTIDECFRTLRTPEAIVVTSPLQARLATIPGTKLKERGYVLFTDDTFWKVFDFNFLAGSAFTEEEFRSGIRKIILSKQFARSFFETPQEAIGKQIQLSFITYTVCGVVDDISPLADPTFAQAWVPYTSVELGASSDPEGVTGRFKCQIIARSRSDFDAIRTEFAGQTKRYSTSLAGYEVEFYRQPDTRYVETKRFGAGYPDIEAQMFSDIVLYIVLLIIPAINLSNFTLSRMRRRMGELGIRRTFGSTRTSLIFHVLSENMMYSLLGGVIGLLVSIATLYGLRHLIFTSTNYFGLDIQSTAPVEVFFNWPVFAAVFLFCLALNVLSAFIPAWKVTSAPIVDSLKNE